VTLQSDETASNGVIISRGGSGCKQNLPAGVSVRDILSDLGQVACLNQIAITAGVQKEHTLACSRSPSRKETKSSHGSGTLCIFGPSPAGWVARKKGAYRRRCELESGHWAMAHFGPRPVAK
jgi:hypothetical protein